MAGTTLRSIQSEGLQINLYFTNKMELANLPSMTVPNSGKNRASHRPGVRYEKRG